MGSFAVNFNTNKLCLCSASLSAVHLPSGYELEIHNAVSYYHQRHSEVLQQNIWACRMLHEQNTRSSGQFVSANVDVRCMTSAESIEQAVHRIASLQSLSVDDLSAFFYSKDGQSEVKESIVFVDEPIRLVAIVGFGSLLLLAWERSLKNDVENFLRFTSLSEARRSRDDFVDFTAEVLRIFSFGVIGRATASDPLQQLLDSPICVQAYSEVLLGLFLRYNTEVLGFDDKVRSVLGLPQKASSDAISWLPILKKVTGALLGHGSELLLLERWREMTWCYEYGRLLSQLFLFLLLDGKNGCGISADKILDRSTLEKGRPRESFESNFEGVSNHTSVRVRKVAEEWVFSLLLQCASLSTAIAIAAIGEALSFGEPNLGLSRDVTAQICNCVVQHSIRLLRLAEGVALSDLGHTQSDPLKGSEEDSCELFRSIRPRLLSYAFIALRCPQLPDEQLSAVCYLLEVVLSMGVEEGGESTLFLLATQGVSCALHPPSPWPTIRCFSLSDPPFLSFEHSYPTDVKHRLQVLLSSASVLVYSNPSYRTRTTRSAFLAALCLCCEDMLVLTVDGANLADVSMVQRQQQSAGGAADNILRALADLTDILSCVPLILDTFRGCLLWEIDDRSGETAQLAFVSLAAAAARILLPTAALSSGRPTRSAISFDFSVLSENLYSPVPTGEPMYPRAVSELRLVAAELEEAMRAISLTLDGALKKSVAHVFSVGACVEWAYMSLMHHADVMEKDTIQNKSLELRMQCLVDLLYDTLVGTCGRKGMDRSTTAITSWPGSRTLGQPSSSTPSSPSPRSDGRKTSSVRNAEEVFHVLHSLTKHASSAVANMCRAVIRNLSSSSTPLPMAIIDHVEMLVSSWTSSDLTSDMNDHNAMATRSVRCPLQCDIVSTSHLYEQQQGGVTRCAMSTSERVALIESVLADNWRGGGGGGIHRSRNISSAALSVPTHSRASASTVAQTSQSLALEALCGGANSDDDFTWVQVSGSGDILTVLVASGQPEKSKRENRIEALVPLRVSVTNTSGFKVPAFSVDVMLLRGGRESVCASPDAVLTRTQPCSTSSTLIGADGLTEYMLPGSTLHKLFYVEVSRLCGIDAVVRLTYPDLAVEDADCGDDFFRSPHLSSPADVQGRGGGRRAGSIIAQTDCAPFHISVIKFLDPSTKLFDALQAIRVAAESKATSTPAPSPTSVARTPQGRVPPEVFESLKGRLPFSALIEHRSEGYGSSSSERLECPSSSSVRTWAFESLWGCSVAVHQEEQSDAVQIHSEHSILAATEKAPRIRTRLCVWCSDSTSLSAILRDRQHFIGDLMGS